ncbi:hypothetical protein ACS0TY_035559 [Phlomoides rotata]
MEESVISEHVDRLSELPQSLIHHILSFLPMTDVVSTTILSKRWNNLWTTVPCLNFCYDLKNSKLDSVRNFVNRVLMFWRGTKILKFKLVMNYFFDLSLAGDFDLWVRFAVEYKVEDLSIDLKYNHNLLDWEDVSVIKGVYWAPQCLNSCSSIRKLTLRGCNLLIHGSPAWNQLKSLIFDGFGISGSLTNQILLGSPRLEVFELSFVETFEDLNIQSTSLKKLKIYKDFNMRYSDDDSHGLLRICCPNVEILEISGLLYDKYFLTNVVSSLTDAILGFHTVPWYEIDSTSGTELIAKTLRQILPTIQHVENLALSLWGVEGLVASMKKCLLSPFPNVKFLKLEFYDIEPSDMMNLLGVFPNLKMLVIENTGESPLFNVEKFLEIEINFSNPFLLPLKTVHITSTLTKPSVFRVIELLLKHATMLEKLVIRVEWDKRCPKFPFKAAKVLLKNMPKSPLTAEVIINTI